MLNRRTVFRSTVAGRLAGRQRHAERDAGERREVWGRAAVARADAWRGCRVAAARDVCARTEPRLERERVERAWRLAARGKKGGLW